MHKISEQLNLKYSLKTRTDCRIYNNNAINHLKNLQYFIDDNLKIEWKNYFMS